MLGSWWMWGASLAATTETIALVAELSDTMDAYALPSINAGLQGRQDRKCLQVCVQASFDLYEATWSLFDGCVMRSTLQPQNFPPGAWVTGCVHASAGLRVCEGGACRRGTLRELACPVGPECWCNCEHPRLFTRRKRVGRTHSAAGAHPPSTSWWPQAMRPELFDSSHRTWSQGNIFHDI